MKRINALTLFIFALCLTSCRKSMPGNGHALQPDYYIDQRTALCFAGISPYKFTHVPCTAKVMALINE